MPIFAAALILQEPAPIRVTTRMVEVGVVVHDQQGRPVTGLRAEDFRLLDGGREEQIRSFSAAGPARRNTPAETHVATAILLDHLNSVFANESLGRVQLLRFLREMEPNQPVALLSLDVGFQVLHDFTTDAQSLVRTLERYRPARPVQAAAFPIAPPLGRFSRHKLGTDAPGAQSIRAMEKLDAVAAAQYRALRAKQTASATAPLAAYLARTPGRKNLIWLSSEFPGALAANVRSDDVAVYPIDLTCPIDGPTRPARMLAEQTGGVAFDHGNDLLRGMRQAVQDSESVYLLGYYPSHEQWDGRFRRIQVRVNRPQIELRHRIGYVAALEDTFRPPDQRETLWYVAASPAEARGIAVAANATRLQDGAVELALAVDRHTLSAEDPGAPGRGEELEVMAVPVLADGELQDADVFTVVAAAAGENVTAVQRITPPRQAGKLRVVVRQTRTGALGSATIAISHLK